MPIQSYQGNPTEACPRLQTFPSESKQAVRRILQKDRTGFGPMIGIRRRNIHIPVAVWQECGFRKAMAAARKTLEGLGDSALHGVVVDETRDLDKSQFSAPSDAEVARS